MKILIALALLAVRLTILNFGIGDDFAKFQDARLLADCYRQSDKVQVCTEPDVPLHGIKFWMRAEFTNDKLSYISLSADQGQKTTKMLLSKLQKDFGPANEDFSCNNSCISKTHGYCESSVVCRSWQVKDTKLILDFEDAADSSVGHDVVRISLSHTDDIVGQKW